MFCGRSLPSPPRQTGAVFPLRVSVISAGRACPAGRRAGSVDGLRRIVAFRGTAGSVRQLSRPEHIQRMRARIPFLRLLCPMRRAAAAGRSCLVSSLKSNAAKMSRSRAAAGCYHGIGRRRGRGRDGDLRGLDTAAGR
jgi:hypothetical protein